MTPALGLSNFGKILIIGTGHTSNQSAVACSASTPFLTTPRTLSTSNQNKSFVSRNRCRAGVIEGVRAGMVSASTRPTRCVYHETHAYCKAGSMNFSVLSFKSLTSEFATPSGSLHMFFSSVRPIRRRQPIRSCAW